jgi:2-amino-4-hydroxy-6-hydroxymethyldihydropteridine diphosphokinase
LEVVFLGLGSNLGNRKKNIDKGVMLLGKFLKDIRVSPLYDSTPQYVEEQPRFCNCVVYGQTSYSPHEVLSTGFEIENHLGRNRKKAGEKGPRPLDVDILLYGDRVIQKDDLIVPHPGLIERKFVLLPLLNLSPYLVHPKTGIYLYEYCINLHRQGVYYFSLMNYS